MNNPKYILILMAALNEPFYEETTEDTHKRNALISSFNFLYDIDGSALNRAFITSLEETNDFINFSFSLHRYFKVNEKNVDIHRVIWNLLNLRTKNIDRAFKFIYYLYINKDELVQPLETEDVEDVLSLYYFDFE